MRDIALQNRFKQQLIFQIIHVDVMKQQVKHKNNGWIRSYIAPVYKKRNDKIRNRSHLKGF